MASSLFVLLDDIATVLDDVSVMTKIAAKKTAGVLGDDLALNAQQVAGVNADRELPVVWAVCKGSFRNKLILVPAALAIGAWAPWGVTPLLMVGGAYLCFEGFEKIAPPFLHTTAQDAVHHEALTQALSNPAVDLIALEKEKITGAVRTDFILSAEIIAITLSVVQAQSLLQQAVVLSGIAVVMTAGVYGLVAGIVKLDDAGLYLSRKPSSALQALGRAILAAAPLLMKTLSVVGTAAMFLVGGGILVHGVAPLQRALDAWVAALAGGGAVGRVLAAVLPVVADGVVGLVAGALVLAGVVAAKRLRR